MRSRRSPSRADLQTFELLSAIDPSSVRQDGGTLTFQATGADGSMRFAGTGVSWQDGLLAFAPGSRLYALDALGRICGISTAVANSGDENNMVWLSDGYTFSSATSVDGPESLYTLRGMSACTRDYRQASPEAAISLLSYQPNFIVFGAEAGNADADGFLDSVIIMNVGTSPSGTMYMGTYGYAQFISPGYTVEGAGTPDRPALKNFVGLNAAFPGSNTLIHEYGHSFGLAGAQGVRITHVDAAMERRVLPGADGPVATLRISPLPAEGLLCALFAKKSAFFKGFYPFGVVYTHYEAKGGWNHDHQGTL